MGMFVHKHDLLLSRCRRYGL